MERTTPEQLDGTVDDTAKNDLDSILKSMREREKGSTRNNQPRSYPWDKKAGAMQTSTSPIEASSDNNKNNTNDSQRHSTTQDDTEYSDNSKDFNDIYSDDGEEVETLQPSRFRTRWELFSDEVPSAIRTKSEESSINMLSDYADSEDQPPTSPEPENRFSKFRQCSADLMTRHVFSRRMNGERPIYVPIYKRNRYGYLCRLKRNEKGRWEYVELEELTESESQARLKLFEDPKDKRDYSN